MRYQVQAINDANMTTLGDVIATTDSLDDAREAASHHTGVYGAAIVDTETGRTDLGGGWGRVYDAEEQGWVEVAR